MRPLVAVLATMTDQRSWPADDAVNAGSGPRRSASDDDVCCWGEVNEPLTTLTKPVQGPSKDWQPATDQLLTMDTILDS